MAALVHASRYSIPQDHIVSRDWLTRLVEDADRKECTATARPWSPVILEFQRLITSDPTLHELATQMFDEIPSRPLYGKDPIGNRQVRDFWHMLNLFNELLVDAQKWDREAGLVGLVGSPFGTVLGWPLCMESGRSFFANKAVNRQFKKILGVSSALLKRAAPRIVLEDQPTTRLGEEAIAILPAHSTRRPKAEKDSSTAAAATRESKPRALQYDIQWKVILWPKGQSYSINSISVYNASHHLEASVSGGTVYQGFGTPRCTVAGTLVRTGP